MMQTDKRGPGWRFVVLGLLAALACGHRTSASELALGENFGPPINFTFFGTQMSGGGGSIGPSTLDGQALPLVYCVDIATDIGVPGTYDNTIVTLDGTINGVAITNAEKVAWLLTNFGLQATQAGGDVMSGFQAALWQVEYGSNFVFESNNSTAMTTAFNSYLSAIAGATIDPTVVSQVWWMNPGGQGQYQGLVTLAQPGSTLQTLATPEPASFGLAATAIVALGGYWYRRRRRDGSREHPWPPAPSTPS